MVDLSLVSDDAWAAVLRPLAQRPHCPRHLARAAARDLGLSERRVYALVRSLREAHGGAGGAWGASCRGGRLRAGGREGDPEVSPRHTLPRARKACPADFGW